MNRRRGTRGATLRGRARGKITSQPHESAPTSDDLSDSAARKRMSRLNLYRMISARLGARSE